MLKVLDFEEADFGKRNGKPRLSILTRPQASGPRPVKSPTLPLKKEIVASALQPALSPTQVPVSEFKPEGISKETCNARLSLNHIAASRNSSLRGRSKPMPKIASTTISAFGVS